LGNVSLISTSPVLFDDDCLDRTLIGYFFGIMLTATSRYHLGYPVIDLENFGARLFTQTASYAKSGINFLHF
jgi:hypothetical protein